jgi:hypothetical protein
MSIFDIDALEVCPPLNGLTQRYLNRHLVLVDMEEPANVDMARALHGDPHFPTPTARTPPVQGAEDPPHGRRPRPLPVYDSTPPRGSPTPSRLSTPPPLEYRLAPMQNTPRRRRRRGGRPRARPPAVRLQPAMADDEPPRPGLGSRLRTGLQPIQDRPCAQSHFLVWPVPNNVSPAAFAASLRHLGPARVQIRGGMAEIVFKASQPDALSFCESSHLSADTSPLGVHRRR